MLVARIIPSHDLCPKCWIQVFSLWVPATVCRTKRSCCLRTFCCLYESCFINNLCSIHSNYFIIFCSTLTMHLKTALMSVYISITQILLCAFLLNIHFLYLSNHHYSYSLSIIDDHILECSIASFTFFFTSAGFWDSWVGHYS